MKITPQKPGRLHQWISSGSRFWKTSSGSGFVSTVQPVSRTLRGGTTTTEPGLEHQILQNRRPFRIKASCSMRVGDGRRSQPRPDNEEQEVALAPQDVENAAVMSRAASSRQPQQELTYDLPVQTGPSLRAAAAPPGRSELTSDLWENNRKLQQPRRLSRSCRGILQRRVKCFLLAVCVSTAITQRRCH